MLQIPKSSVITAWEWTGARISYPDVGVKGDTFPMTWGDDDETLTHPSPS